MSLVLRSDRLTLTPFEIADTDIAVELFTDPEVHEYAGHHREAHEVIESMPTWVRRGGDGCIGIWCIAITATGEKLGTAALLPMPVEDNETDWNQVVPGFMPETDIEIGYFIKKSAWGHGYATEASRRLLRFAFEDSPLQEVVATIDEANRASHHVLVKSGFVDRGRRRCYGADGPYFSITREEWLRSGHRRPLP